MKKFALTGGLACGKSTVSKLLKIRGWQVIDTDEISHDLLEPDTDAYKKVIDSFGSSILKELRRIDRSLLGNIVFKDPEKRSLLNSILHPLIRAEWQRRHSVLVQRGPTLVVIPLLFETGMNEWFDAVACVGSFKNVQEKRLSERGLTQIQIDLRIAAQMNLENKMKQSDVVIWNNGSEALLNKQVMLLEKSWKPL